MTGCGPSPDQLAAIAASWGLRLEAADAAAHAGVAAELLAGVERIADGADPDAPSPQPVSTPTGRQDPLNAIVRCCDVATQAGGPLAGLRVSVKDTVAIAGVPLSGGSAALESYVPARDSVVARRVLDAGGRIVAVTNMDDLAFCADGSSGHHGPVLNPIDRTRTAGGSSGGAAASLSYDGVDVAIGGDQGGSIRVPASWCGVVGFKPTFDRIPCAGVLGGDPTLDHVGPLARTVGDAALLFDVLDGRYATDATAAAAAAGTAPAAALVAQAPRDVRGLRFGLVRESLSPGLGVEPGTADALRGLARELAAKGAEVVDVSIPQHLGSAGVETAISCEGLVALLRSGGNGHGRTGPYAPDLAVALREGLARRASELSPHVHVGLLVGTWLAARFRGESYARAQRARRALRAAYDRALVGLDALLLPTTPWPARPLPVGGALADRLDAGWGTMANTAQFNLTGHPAISLPVCEVDGLPQGAMLVGPHRRDAELLACARSVEATVGRVTNGD